MLKVKLLYDGASHDKCFDPADQLIVYLLYYQVVLCSYISEANTWAFGREISRYVCIPQSTWKACFLVYAISLEDICVLTANHPE